MRSEIAFAYLETAKAVVGAVCTDNGDNEVHSTLACAGQSEGIEKVCRALYGHSCGRGEIAPTGDEVGAEFKSPFAVRHDTALPAEFCDATIQEHALVCCVDGATLEVQARS